MAEPQTDLEFLRMALEEADKCDPKPTAFNVGCTIVVRGRILARGYSRELPGNTHAEANALAKARRLSSRELQEYALPGSPEPDIDHLLREADVYTTMEPCSVRTSGLAPCADALIEAQIQRCLIGVAEPDDFVKCEGAQKLKDAGVEVIWLKGLERECLDVARKGRIE